MTLIYGRLWESASRSVKGGPLGFPVVPHKDRVFSHHLEVGPFSSYFVSPSVPGPFWGDDDNIRRPREVVEFI